MQRLIVIMLLLASTSMARALLAVPLFPEGRPDSTQLERLRYYENYKIRVRLLDGKEIRGWATLTDSGLVLTSSHLQNISLRVYETDFARWNQIDSIRQMEKSPRWPAILLCSVAIISLYLLISLRHFT